jgi:hypothetical protein
MTASLPSNAPEPVLLIIADISGYTRYMTANAKTLAHSQTIITELVKTIIQVVEVPLEVAKLEGDAVFLFCRKSNGLQPWPESKRIIGEKLLTFFGLFAEKIALLSQSTTCTCQACTHINTLRLKVVVHSGEALFHHVFNFLELAGLDVIIVHRLLKNSVSSDQYLLLTEPARQDLEFPAAISWIRGLESYDEIGRINTLLYLPSPGTPAAFKGKAATRSSRIVQSSKLFCKLWFSPLARRKQLTHVSSGATALGRAALGLLVIVLTPLFLPVGLTFAAIRAINPRRGSHHEQTHDHEHRPDGSCCGTAPAPAESERQQSLGSGLRQLD